LGGGRARGEWRNEQPEEHAKPRGLLDDYNTATAQLVPIMRRPVDAIDIQATCAEHRRAARSPGRCWPPAQRSKTAEPWCDFPVNRSPVYVLPRKVVRLKTSRTQMAALTSKHEAFGDAQCPCHRIAKYTVLEKAVTKCPERQRAPLRESELGTVRKAALRCSCVRLDASTGSWTKNSAKLSCVCQAWAPRRSYEYRCLQCTRSV